VTRRQRYRAELVALIAVQAGISFMLALAIL
jgi:hypothetical protein